MTKRTVSPGIGMITYTDASGRRRIGQAGEEVDVHPDDVARFNRVSGGTPQQKAVSPTKKAAPVKKAARRKT